MSERPIQVVKVGGSLLTQAGFASAIRNWLNNAAESDSHAHRVLVVGGGPLVEALRQLDSKTPLREEFAHWRAIELMDVAGRVVGQWLHDVPVVDRWQELRVSCGEPGCTLFLPGQFLETQEPHLPGDRLPVGWHVTSDSIAARVAICLGATRLVLLKSREATASELADWHAAAGSGLVDEHFAQSARFVPKIDCQTL